MHYQPTPFRANTDQIPPRDIASARAALFVLLRDHPLDPEPGSHTEAAPMDRPRIPKATPELTKLSKWYSGLHEEDSFVFCSAT